MTLLLLILSIALVLYMGREPKHHGATPASDEEIIFHQAIRRIDHDL